MFDSIPSVFDSAINQPAFSIEQTSFCVWRTIGDIQWHRGNLSFPQGNDPDGSARLLEILDGSPSTYKEWAEAYYHRTISLLSVERIYAYRPLTDDVVRALNSEGSLPGLADDIAEIGYPTT